MFWTKRCKEAGGEVARRSRVMREPGVRLEGKFLACDKREW